MKVMRSDCCNQPVTMQHAYTGHGHIPDFEVTAWYRCTGCGEPTDIIEIEVKNDE